MLLHVDDAFRTVDTDAVVLAVTGAQRLNIDELWVAFATGMSFRFLAANEIAKTRGPNKCQALPFFHAFNGCHIVSCFGGRCKKTAWETWKSDDGVTAAFCGLSATPNPTTNRRMYWSLVERFVVLLYNRTNSQEHVNDARRQLFTHNCRTIDVLPPTRAALIQHALRAAYQAGYCWGQMMIPAPDLTSPSEWRWVQTVDAGIYTGQLSQMIH